MMNAIIAQKVLDWTGGGIAGFIISLVLGEGTSFFKSRNGQMTGKWIQTEIQKDEKGNIVRDENGNIVPVENSSRYEIELRQINNEVKGSIFERKTTKDGRDRKWKFIGFFDGTSLIGIFLSKDQSKNPINGSYNMSKITEINQKTYLDGSFIFPGQGYIEEGTGDKISRSDFMKLVRWERR